MDLFSHINWSMCCGFFFSKIGPEQLYMHSKKPDEVEDRTRYNLLAVLC